MKGIRELLLLIRFGQARLSVAYYLQDIDRAKAGLAKAFTAYDDAKAALGTFEVEDQPTPPTFLLRNRT